MIAHLGTIIESVHHLSCEKRNVLGGESLKINKVGHDFFVGVKERLTGTRSLHSTTHAFDSLFFVLGCR